MFLFILWSFLSLSSFWFIICVLLKASVRERDPASWHYRFIEFCYKQTPERNSCDYFRKLFFCPYHFVFILIVIGIVMLFALFLDFVWLPFIFGSYTKYKIEENDGENRYVTANPFKGHYWYSSERENWRMYAYREKMTPFPPYYLYILAFVALGLIALVPYVPSLFTPGSDSLTAICTLLLIIGVCACVVSVVILRPKIKVLTNKLCFDLPLKQNSEPAESE